MSGIGGYVRRGDRHHIPPAPDDGIPQCEHCKARLDIVTPWNQPHICKELTIGTPLPPLPVLPLEVPASAGGFLQNMPGVGHHEPGPPYTHTIVPPEPAGWDKDGNPIYPEPGPAFTIADIKITVDENQEPGTITLKSSHNHPA